MQKKLKAENKKKVEAVKQKKGDRVVVEAIVAKKYWFDAGKMEEDRTTAFNSELNQESPELNDHDFQAQNQERHKSQQNYQTYNY